jgi:putative hemolysin
MSVGNAVPVTDVLISLALVLLFVLIGGYFSASELAVVTLRDSQVDRLAGSGKRGARVAELRADSNRFLAAVQIGVTLAGFFASAYGGSTLSGPLGDVLVQWGMPAGIARTVGLVVVTAFISYLSLVLGELAPKRLAIQRSEGVALFVAPTLDRIAKISRPVIWLLSRSTNVVVRMLGLDPRGGGEEVTEEELRDMVSSHGELGAEERRVLTDVFEAADRQLNSVMVPRTEVEFLPAATPLTDAARHVLDKPHSRYPVIGQTVDDVVGVVHVRDLLTAALTGSETGARTVGDLARPVPLLPGSKPVLASLTEMRANRTHLAVVVDEYGGTDGIVTMEDILEELVGEIEDEYDPAALARLDSSEFDGLLHREELADLTGITLPDGPYETLAGFVQAQLGRVPDVGDTFEAHRHRFTVVEMDGRRVARVRVAPPTTTVEGAPVPDGAVPDSAVPDGAVPDGAVPDGAVPDGAVPDGAVPDGAVPDRSAGPASDVSAAPATVPSGAGGSDSGSGTTAPGRTAPSRAAPTRPDRTGVNGMGTNGTGTNGTGAPERRPDA